MPPTASTAQNKNGNAKNRTPLHDRKRRRLNGGGAKGDLTPSILQPLLPLASNSPSKYSLSTYPAQTVATPEFLFGAQTPVTVTPFSISSSPTVLGSAAPPSDPFGAKPFATPCPIKHSTVTTLTQQPCDDDAG